MSKRLMRGALGAALLGCASMLATAPIALAQSTPKSSGLVSASKRKAAPVRPANGTPMQQLLTRAPTGGLPSISTQSNLLGAPGIAAGNPGPAAALTPPKSAEPDSGTSSGARNYGSGQLNTVWHYNDRHVTSYVNNPWRTYGKLWFRETSSGGWSWCTAALISRSLAVTAGHCVHRGNNSQSGWNYETYFYPATNEIPSPDYDPFGGAQGVQLWTNSNWYAQGSLNATLGKGWDVGLVVLDKRFLADGTPTSEEMGYRTGYNGFCHTNCLQNYWSLSQYGYPGNYYSGQAMTESQHLAFKGNAWASFAGGDYVAGSGMEGGSSGGPSVSNPGFMSDSAVYKGAYVFRNIIFAVTSWGYPGGTFKVQGYSPLSGPANVNNFKGMFNAACTTARSLHGTGSCSLFP